MVSDAAGSVCWCCGAGQWAKGVAPGGARSTRRDQGRVTCQRAVSQSYLTVSAGIVRANFGHPILPDQATRNASYVHKRANHS